MATTPGGSGGSGHANEWRAWPGGQADTDLNPKESFSSADFGFAGKVDWNVGAGGVAALTVETGTTTASNRDKITVRYDIRSPSSAKAKAAMVQAIKGTETKSKHRTVFSVSWSLKFTGNVDADDSLRFPVQLGTATDKCGFNWAGEDNATFIAAKMESTCTFSPAEIDWAARGVSFKYGADMGTNFFIALNAAKDSDGAVSSLRDIAGDRNVVWNDNGWVYDGVSTDGDTQNPSAAKPNRAFAIDGPGFNPSAFKQGANRVDLMEITEWHDGIAWRQISVSAEGEWHANATAILPLGTKDGANNGGAGVPADNVPNKRPLANAGPAQTVASGALVTLDGSASSDADNDTLRYNWVHTTGPLVTLSDPSAQKPTFTAPTGPTAIGFELKVFDNTVGLHYHNPLDGVSDPATVTITIS